MVCPSNAAPPLGMVQWSGTPAARAWAQGALTNAAAGATVYGVVEGAHVAARMEYGIQNGACVSVVSLFHPADEMLIVSSPAVAQQDGPTALALAGFAFLAFSTAFGLTWAFIKGETP